MASNFSNGHNLNSSSYYEKKSNAGFEIIHVGEKKIQINEGSATDLSTGKQFNEELTWAGKPLKNVYKNFGEFVEEVPDGGYIYIIANHANKQEVILGETIPIDSMEIKFGAQPPESTNTQQVRVLGKVSYREISGITFASVQQITTGDQAFMAIGNKAIQISTDTPTPIPDGGPGNIMEAPFNIRFKDVTSPAQSITLVTSIACNAADGNNCYTPSYDHETYDVKRVQVEFQTPVGLWVPYNNGLIVKELFFAANGTTNLCALSGCY